MTVDELILALQKFRTEAMGDCEVLFDDGEGRLRSIVRVVDARPTRDHMPQEVWLRSGT